MLSVLIVNWNTREMLVACLRSIYSDPLGIPLEVVVVDNGSEDGSAEAVEAEFGVRDSLKLIRAGANLGYAAGNNLAFSLCSGSYVLTLNPDTEVRPEVLEESVRILDRLEGFGCLTVRFLGPDGETQRSVRNFPTLANIFGDVFGFGRIAPQSALGNYRAPMFNYELSGPCEQPMTTYLLFKRTDLPLSSGGEKLFDERFPIFFNDVDLLKRMVDGGKRCWYEATLSIMHHHGGSTRLVKKSMIWESHKSLVRYFAKHLRGISRIALPFVAVLSYLAAFVRARGYHGGFRPEHNDLQLEHDR